MHKGKITKNLQQQKIQLNECHFFIKIGTLHLGSWQSAYISNTLQSNDKIRIT